MTVVVVVVLPLRGELGKVGFVNITTSIADSTSSWWSRSRSWWQRWWWWWWECSLSPRPKSSPRCESSSRIFKIWLCTYFIVVNFFFGTFFPARRSPEFTLSSVSVDGITTFFGFWRSDSFTCFTVIFLFSFFTFFFSLGHDTTRHRNKAIRYVFFFESDNYKIKNQNAKSFALRNLSVKFFLHAKFEWNLAIYRGRGWNVAFCDWVTRGKEPSRVELKMTRG